MFLNVKNVFINVTLVSIPKIVESVQKILLE
jgi:hypothetical protein